MLRDRGLLGLVAARAVSQVGSEMTFLALPWFVLTTTGSPAKMGWVLAAELAPVALLGLPSGSLVNRLGAYRTMLGCDAARAALVCAIPALHAAGALTFPLLLALVFGIGCFMAPYGGAGAALVPELVGDDETLVARVNALREGTGHGALIVGPALAGVLIGFAGASAVLYVDAATYLLSFLLLATLVRGRGGRVRETEHRGVLAGARFLAHDRLLGPTTLTVVALALFFHAVAASLPVLAYDHFDENARLAGWFFAAFGVGGIAGAALAFRVVGRVEPLRLAAAAIAVATLPVWLLALPIPAWAVLGVVAVIALGLPLVNAPMASVIVVRTPAELRAKVSTAITGANALAAPLALVGAGVVMEATDVRLVLALAAAGLTVSGLVFAAIALSHAGRGAQSPGVVVESA
jgi:MFS family permease